MRAILPDIVDLAEAIEIYPAPEVLKEAGRAYLELLSACHYIYTEGGSGTASSVALDIVARHLKNGVKP